MSQPLHYNQQNMVEQENRLNININIRKPVEKMGKRHVNKDTHVNKNKRKKKALKRNLSWLNIVEVVLSHTWKTI